MKKSLIALLLMVSFAMTFTGCKKDEEEDNNSSLEVNTWTVDGTTYKTLSAVGTIYSKEGKTLIASQTTDPKSTLTLTFGEEPTNGTYSIVGGATTPTGKQASILLNAGGGNYLSIPGTSSVVTVTIKDGKVTAVLPKTKVSTLDDSKSAEVAANLAQVL